MNEETSLLSLEFFSTLLAEPLFYLCICFFLYFCTILVYSSLLAIRWNENRVNEILGISSLQIQNLDKTSPELSNLLLICQNLRHILRQNYLVLNLEQVIQRLSLQNSI